MCCLAFSITSSGSARVLAALMYVLSCCMIGLTPCGGSSGWRNEAALARPGGTAARIVDRPPSLIKRRRVAITRSFSPGKCFSAWLIFILSALGQRFHYAKQFVFGFKADARNLRKADVTIFHGDAVRESTEGLKNSWVGFVASESQSSGDIQRHLVAAVWNATRGGPAVLFQHIEDAQIFDEAVT